MLTQVHGFINLYEWYLNHLNIWFSSLLYQFSYGMVFIWILGSGGYGISLSGIVNGNNDLNLWYLMILMCALDYFTI